MARAGPFPRAAVKHKASRQPPGPWLTLPFIGETLSFFATHPTSFFFQRFCEYGPVFRIELFGIKNCYVVADPAALKVLLRDENSPVDIPSGGFKLLMRDLGHLQSPQQHSLWRRMQTNALGGDAIKKMLPAVTEIIESRVREWAATGHFDLNQACCSLSMDLAIDVVVGMPLKNLDVPWIKRCARTFMDGLYAPPFNLPGSTLRKAMHARTALGKALWQELRGTIGELEAKVTLSGSKPAGRSSLGSTDLDNERTKAPPCMGMLEAQVAAALPFKPLGQDTVVDLMLHNIAAAADTTAVGLFHVLALLASLPEQQALLLDEQRKVIAAHGDSITPAAVACMPHLEACVKECMRILPASQGSFRRVGSPLPAGRYVVPAGAFVWFHPGLLHATDPALWDGDTSVPCPPHMDWQHGLTAAFKPERWLGGATGLHAYTFGAGLHRCLGQKLAFNELQVLVASLVRVCRWKLQHPDFLRSCQMFPVPRPASGLDRVVITLRSS
ncbi:MAG: hypothetical protein WDW36_002262 [Sanguina aurantia]